MGSLVGKVHDGRASGGGQGASSARRRSRALAGGWPGGLPYPGASAPSHVGIKINVRYWG